MSSFKALLSKVAEATVTKPLTDADVNILVALVNGVDATTPYIGMDWYGPFMVRGCSDIAAANETASLRKRAARSLEIELLRRQAIAPDSTTMPKALPAPSEEDEPDTIAVETAPTAVSDKTA